MYGGEAFGTMAYGATGTGEAPSKMGERGTSIDDLCLMDPEDGVTIDEYCEC